MITSTWQALDGDLRRLEYASYDEYLGHQQAKLDRMDPVGLASHEARFLAALQPRLAVAGFARGTTVLCLGARGGAEVRVFLALGCMAVGLDLNPGQGNPYVLPGDFHALPYGEGTIAVVFTNALDHCYDIDRVLTEVRRVLSPDGQFLVEAVRGTGEGCALGPYESFGWETVDALVQAIEARGFTSVRREPFACPWPGEHLVFTVEGA